MKEEFDGLVAVNFEVGQNRSCKNCYFYDYEIKIDDCGCEDGVICTSDMRKDGRSVIFIEKQETKEVPEKVDNNVMLSKMIGLVASEFVGKVDKGGMPYVLHCLKVMHYTKSDDLELMMIAVGHDLIEDTKITEIDLKKMGFSNRVVRAISLLTKKEGQSYEDYKEAVFSNQDAMIVKMADLRHNSDIRRLKGLREKDIKRMVKYHEFYTELKERLG